MTALRFTRGVNLLNRGIRTAGKEVIAYRRANESIVGLEAVPGNVSLDQNGDEQTAVTTRDQDWFIWVADLVKAGTVWIPERGDAIDWTDANGTLRTFKVIPRSSERCYRHTDQTKQQYRVYTVETTPNTE